MKAGFFRRAWVTFSVGVIGTYASLLNRFRAAGWENIPSTGGVLVCSNHISGYDTVLLPWAVIRRHPLQMLWAPAKEELFKGFPGLLYRSWGAFPVKRGRDVRAAGVINELLAGQKVMLFPEGTRHRDGVLGKGNRGVGKIIYDTRPVVIPTALSGINRWSFPRFGQEGSVVFGAPLQYADLLELPDTKETHQAIVDRVMAEIAALLEREETHARVEIFCDGACSGNPGPGGWGTILRYRGTEKELSGGAAETTNNRMELMAAISGLEALTRACRVRITTDSQYVVKGITEWIHGWKKKGWVTSGKAPVVNRDLWERLLEQTEKHEVEWVWVRGHDGHKENERCDELARKAVDRGRK